MHKFNTRVGSSPVPIPSGPGPGPSTGPGSGSSTLSNHPLRVSNQPQKKVYLQKPNKLTVRSDDVINPPSEKNSTPNTVTTTPRAMFIRANSDVKVRSGSPTIRGNDNSSTTPSDHKPLRRRVSVLDLEPDLHYNAQPITSRKPSNTSTGSVKPGLKSNISTLSSTSSTTLASSTSTQITPNTTSSIPTVPTISPIISAKMSSPKLLSPSSSASSPFISPKSYASSPNLSTPKLPQEQPSTERESSPLKSTIIFPDDSNISNGTISETTPYISSTPANIPFTTPSATSPTIHGPLLQPAKIIPQSLISKERSERKIKDLEITNNSLLSINRYLEKKINRQKKEIARLASNPPTITTTIETSFISSDDETDEEYDDDSYTKTSSADTTEDFSSVNSSFEDNTTIFEHVQERAKAHISFLKSAEKFDNALRQCLFITDSLLREAHDSLDYKVNPSDIGGKLSIFTHTD